MSKWYFKTFRIFDSPDKDVPEKTAVDGTYDTSVGLAIVKAHNEVVTRLENEIERLWKCENKIDALEAAGVDNWEGYDEAMIILRERET